MNSFDDKVNGIMEFFSKSTLEELEKFFDDRKDLGGMQVIFGNGKMDVKFGVLVNFKTQEAIEKVIDELYAHANENTKRVIL